MAAAIRAVSLRPEDQPDARYFLAATALTVSIAVATVGAQVLAVARSEPAKALRHE